METARQSPEAREVLRVAAGIGKQVELASAFLKAVVIVGTFQFLETLVVNVVRAYESLEDAVVVIVRKASAFLEASWVTVALAEVALRTLRTLCRHQMEQQWKVSSSLLRHSSAPLAPTRPIFAP